MKLTRRNCLAAGAVLALGPRFAMAGEGTRLSFRGSLEQGGLVIGLTGPGTGILADGRQLLVSLAGVFAFGLAYDRTEPVKVSAAFADGSSETSEVTPLVRQYQVESFTGVEERYVSPSPEEIARMERERALIAEARKRETDGVGFADPFDWPFPGIVSGRFGSQRFINGKPMSPHLGVDIAAPEGTPIHAPADGVVSLVGDFFLEGGFTLVDHGHGVSSCYLHQSERKATVGEALKRGDVLGLVGKTGRATGPHMHWGLCWFQVKLDPSRLTKTPEPPPA